MCIRDSIEGVWCGKRMVHRGVVLTAGNNESCALAVCRILGNGCVPAPLRDLNITRALSNVCPASLLECSRISDQPRFGHCVADRTKSRRIRRTRPVRPLISSTNWVDCTQAEMQDISPNDARVMLRSRSGVGTHPLPRMRHTARAQDSLLPAVRTPLNDSELHHNAPVDGLLATCLLYTSPSPRDRTRSRMPSS